MEVEEVAGLQTSLENQNFNALIEDKTWWKPNMKGLFLVKFHHQIENLNEELKALIPLE